MDSVRLGLPGMLFLVNIINGHAVAADVAVSRLSRSMRWFCSSLQKLTRRLLSILSSGHGMDGGLAVRCFQYSWSC